MSIMLFTTLLLLVSPRISAEPEGWKDDVRLTNDPEDSDRPSIAIDSQNNIHVVWYLYIKLIKI